MEEAVKVKKVTELYDNYRKGLLNRRDFVQKLIATTGGMIAASHFLSTLGFDAGIIREARAQGLKIEESTGKYPYGNEEVDYFLAKPIEGGPFPTMIVIHEVFGISEFIQNVTRKFAQQGFLALAPHVFPFMELSDGKHAPWMMQTLETGVALVPDNEIDALNAGFLWLTQRRDVDVEHIGSVGFCWGGARSFSLATRNQDLWVAIVFYGSTPSLKELENITAPVLGLYGALDNNGPASITGRAAETARDMRELDKVFEWEVYNRAAHGFFRAPDQSVSEERPAILAWDLLLDFMARYYERG